MIKEVTLRGFRQAMPVDGSSGKEEMANREKKEREKKKKKSARSAIIITGDGDTNRNTELPRRRERATRQEGLVASCLNQR